MAKRKQAADASNEQATDAAATGTTDEADDTGLTPIAMEDFIGRADRADWLSVADAAAYLGGDMDAQKMRNASNNRAEFKTEGAKLLVNVPGYSIKPLTYLHRSAVDTYRDNNASGNTRGGRILANGKRWIIRVKQADHNAVVEALAAFGITLEQASAPHKPKDAADADAASADQPAADAAPATDTAPLGNGVEANGVEGDTAEWTHAEDVTA